MQTPVIFVIGPPGHGKTAARKILSELTSQRGESCSSAVKQFLALRRGLDKDAYRLTEKDTAFRDQLIEAGDYIVGKLDSMKEPAVVPEIEKALYRVPSALIRMLYLNGNNIIDGVRRLTELESGKDHLAWNGVRSVTVWVEKSQGPVIPDNTDVTALNADVVIMNDGTLEELKDKLYKDVLVAFFGEQDELNKEVPIADSPAAAVAAAEAAKPTKDDLG